MKVGIKRLIAVFLAMVLCWMQLGSAFASSTSGTQAEEGTNVGSSLYDVTTALTAFANNVLGVNNNANQANDDQDDDRPHKLTELANGLTQNGCAGAIVGYGDADKGFQPFLSSNDTKAMTVSSYSAYMNIGDNGKAYSYVRYGRLLQDLGLDEIGNVAQISVGRTWGGKALAGMRVVSDIVPDGFKLALQLLNLLNPFWLLTGEGKYNSQGQGSAIMPGTIHDPWTREETTPDPIKDERPTNVKVDESVNTEVFGEGQAGVTAAETAMAKRDSALDSVRTFFTNLYNGFTSIGITVILPLLLALLIAGILLTRNGNNSPSATPKIVLFLKRAVFIVIGVPLLATLYSAVLSGLTTETLGTKPSSRIIAASFVDFESWVTSSRLALPDSVTLVSKKVSDSEEQGEASGATWRAVRVTAYDINYHTGLYGLPAESGISLTSFGDNNAGMFNETAAEDGSMMLDGTYTTELTATGLTEAEMRGRLNALLTVYSSGRTYTSGSWNSAVMGWAAKELSDEEMGNLQNTDESSTNKFSFYQMLFDTDEVGDWMKRNVDGNENVFIGHKGDQEVLWADQPWNIFDNGGSIGDNAITNIDIEYRGDWGYGWRNGVDPTQVKGLSTVSMYNFLATNFDTSAIRVYSGVKSVSEFGRMQHFSVSLVGSGVLKVLFWISCFVCLGIFVVLGVAYCGGMVIHNVKHGFSLLMSIPGAMLGVMKSIAQVLVYFVSMILELFVTIFLYDIITTFVITFSSLIEGALSPKLTEMAGTTTPAPGGFSIIGGLFGNAGMGTFAERFYDDKTMFIVGLIGVLIGLFVITYGALKLCRAFQVAWAYASIRFWRLMTCSAMLPTFDRVVASYPSLYVWDNVRADFGSLFDILTPEINVSGKEVVQA